MTDADQWEVKIRTRKGYYSHEGYNRDTEWFLAGTIEFPGVLPGVKFEIGRWSLWGEHDSELPEVRRQAKAFIRSFWDRVKEDPEHFQRASRYHGSSPFGTTRVAVEAICKALDPTGCDEE